MRKLIFLVAVAATTMLSSCVSQKEYAKLQADYASIQKDLNDTRVELASCVSSKKGIDDRLSEAKANNEELQQAVKALQTSLDKSIHSSGANINKLVDEINASNKYIKQLVEAKSKSDSLNLALSNKLTRSLSKSELADVDVQVLKGVVYISLNDNMLYKSGSYEISEKAGETLSKIAKIITDYKEYEVLVEGNTDNVPINKPNIRNNWDLSCLRASSVVQALQNQYGVDPSRLSAAGRGEYNTIESNDTPEGRARNRRTQIIITPLLDQFLELIDQAPSTEQ